MKMQGTAQQKYVCKSGNSYTADANGYVANVVAGDVVNMLNMGCVPVDTVLNQLNLNLLTAKNSDGSSLAAAAAAGKFGAAITLGTSMTLVGEVALSNTKTDTALFEFEIPQDYNAGDALHVAVDALINIGAGTAGTKTVLAHFYRCDGQGLMSADLVTTLAQNLGNARAEYDFAVTGATLNPGDRCIVSLVIALQETAASAINAVVNSVAVKS